MTREEKVVCGISPEGTGDGVPLVILGVPKGAWEYMKDGKTHTFDLTAAGVPVKLVLFGGKDHEECSRLLVQAGTIDARGVDFSIQPKKDAPQ